MLQQSAPVAQPDRATISNSRRSFCACFRSVAHRRGHEVFRAFSFLNTWRGIAELCSKNPQTVENDREKRVARARGIVLKQEKHRKRTFAWSRASVGGVSASVTRRKLIREFEITACHDTMPGLISISLDVPRASP